MQIISYVALGSSIIFFITVAINLYKNPKIYPITFWTSVVGVILLLVTWISMIVDIVQGGGGYEGAYASNGDSSSEGIFIGNALLTFFTFNTVAYVSKKMPGIADKEKEQETPASTFIGNNRT